MTANLRTTLCAILLATSTNYAQTRLEGMVVDGQTGDGLPQVIISTSSNQSISDIQGWFIINLSEQDSTIVFQRLGYQTLKVDVSTLSPTPHITLKPDLLQLNQVVISADHVQRSYHEYPGGVGLILSKDLEREQDIAIANALNRVPGVVMQSGALNTNRITIRGMGSRSPFSTNRVKAYYGKIPLTTGDGETTMEDIDMAFIDRVEIIKGPNASLYGAGLGGTILLTPKSVAHGLQVDAGQSFGSFGLSRQLFNISKGNDNLDMQAGITRTKVAGYRENNDYERLSALATATLKTDNHTFKFLGQFISLDAQIPSSLDQATFESDPEAAAANWLAVAGFESYEKYLAGISHRWSGNRVNSNTAIFANFQTMDERRPFNVLEDDRYILGFRTVWTGSITEKMFWSGGTELLFETYDWETFETLQEGRGASLSYNLEERWYQNIFVQWEWSFHEKWNTILGMNANFTHFDLEDRFLSNGDLSGTRNFDPVLSPRIALSYVPSEKITIYTSANHGFSTPSLEETLAPEGTVNTAIEPEMGWVFELGSKGSVTPGLNYQVAVYHMPVENLLVARRTAEDAFIGINAGKTIHNGLEIDLRKNWVTTKGNMFSLFLSYLEAQYYFDDFEDDGERFDENDLTGTPDRTVTGGIDVNTFWGFNVHLNAQHVGEMPLNDANTLHNDPYTVWNLKLTQQLSRKDWKLTLFAGVNNLFDDEYAPMVQINAQSFGGNAPRYFYPGLPRNYFGGIMLRFSR